MTDSPRIGVMLPNWIGDVAMATPMLRALRQHFGARARIIGIARPYVSEVLQGTNWLDEMVLYNRRSPQVSQQFYRVAKNLRRRSLDWIFLLPNSFSSASLAWISGAKRRVGYARNRRSWLLTDICRAPREGKTWLPISAVDYYLELAYSIGCERQSRNLELATLADDERIAEQIWNDLHLTGRSVIAFNTGSAAGGTKDWPLEHFIELARRTLAETDASILVLCGPKERERAASIEREINCTRLRSMAGQNLGLGVARACIRRSRAMVTTDSGPRHVAAAFGVPTVALLGPIEPRWSVNYNPRETALWEAIECAPCGKYACPLGHHRCMKDLSVDRVFNALIALLDRTVAATKVA
jgi:heptosyltransferase-2